MFQVNFKMFLMELIVVWTSVAMAEVRSSDPFVQIESAVSDPVSNIAWDEIVSNLPLGNPDTMDSDIPGEPLSPEDFEAATNMIHDTIDTADRPDPIELAGLYEGDIALSNPQELHDMMDQAGPAKTRNAIIDMSKRWPNGVIPYVISSSYNSNERATIAMAMRGYQEKTCIRFVPRSVERDYIHIIKGDGCSSAVGRTGGAQAVSLGPGCLYVGIVMHEFMHAAGFWHEQSRADRDNYITINTVNIQQGMEYNFQKYEWNIIQSLGVEYDLGSIMHYGPYAFARDRTKPTIIPRVTGAEIGQRRAFSDKDIEKLQSLYNCATSSGITEVVTTSPVTIAPTGGTCEDNNKFCSTWSSMGECDKNPTWMNSNCAKSCKQCGKECPDNSEHCNFWASNGECHKNAAYMSLYCKKSCGLCHSASEYQAHICEDKNKHCQQWAQDNQCRSNPNYMLLWCRKSCKAC
ncbi:zinc metalloproteinase nas-4-like [Macrobrachium nipponense]|uniref:zinc metalloproteinase nas-4-like n=1 Tax=Macrobrachium nipponense TaxID=159736 RepID=UPI0030C7FE52